MYGSRYQPGQIVMARMDGSGGVPIVTRELDHPGQIVIDYSTSRLLWVEQLARKNFSSDLSGVDLQQFNVQSRSILFLHGIALTSGNNYVSFIHSLEALNRDGQHNTVQFWRFHYVIS